MNLTILNLWSRWFEEMYQKFLTVIFVVFLAGPFAKSGKERHFTGIWQLPSSAATQQPDCQSKFPTLRRHHHPDPITMCYYQDSHHNSHRHPTTLCYYQDSHHNCHRHGYCPRRHWYYHDCAESSNEFWRLLWCYYDPRCVLADVVRSPFLALVHRHLRTVVHQFHSRSQSCWFYRRYAMERAQKRETLGPVMTTHPHLT